MVEGEAPVAPERLKGRLPRITRYMALAIYYEELIHNGHVHGYAEIATLGHAQRARVIQTMNLRLLAPEIQDCLLSLPRITSGQDTVSFRSLQWVDLQPEWKQQRRRWKELKGQT